MKNTLKVLLIVMTLMMGVGIVYATTLNFVETPTDFLYTSLSSAGTSMIVTPYPTDLDGNKLTMTDFGSNPTLTIDPGVKSYEEIIRFTGIVDNGNNTATLTGLTRDLTSKSPYTNTGSGRQHGAGALVVFSNNPQMYARLAALENAETISGLWTFSTSPVVPTPTLGTQVANKAYADSIALAGAPNASTVLQGLVQIATALQAASTTSTGSTGAILVIPASMSTSTPGSNATLQNVMSLNDGKLSPNWLNGTGEQYTFNATTTMSSAVIATTTITTANIASTSIATINANNINFGGALSGNVIPLRYSFATTTLISQGNSTAYATSSPIVIPANILTASSTIEIMGNVSCGIGSNSGAASNNYCGFEIVTANGTPFVTLNNGNGGFLGANSGSITSQGTFETRIINNGSASSQISITGGVIVQTNGTISSSNQGTFIQTNTSSINTAAGLSLYVVIYNNQNYSLASLKSFVVTVNP